MFASALVGEGNSILILLTCAFSLQPMFLSSPISQLFYSLCCIMEHTWCDFIARVCHTMKSPLDLKVFTGQTFNIPLNSQNIHLCREKPKRNGPFLSTISILMHYNCQQASLAVDGQDENG